MDSAKVSAEMKTYKKIPVIAEFIDSDGKDILHGTIESNYHRGKQEIIAMVESKIGRVKTEAKFPKLYNIE